MPQRATAYKMKIKEVINAPYHAGTTLEDPNYIEANGLKISRISVVGRISEKKERDDSNYSSATLENRGEKILVKFFDKNVDVNVGDVVKVIGKTREGQEGRFILGEIAKRITENELRLHELESASSPENDSAGSFVQDAGSV